MPAGGQPLAGGDVAGPGIQHQQVVDDLLGASHGAAVDL
jgi:hypothetical protein